MKKLALLFVGLLLACSSVVDPLPAPAVVQAATGNVLIIRLDPVTKVITVLKTPDTGQGGSFVSFTSSLSQTAAVVTDQLYSGLQ